MTGHVIRHVPERAREPRLERAHRVNAGEIFEEIARVARDELGIVGSSEPRVFLLEHVAARRARRDDLAALAHGGGERADVVLHERAAFVDGAAVQIRHAAAALRWRAHVDTVVLEHRDGGLSDRGIVVFDGARREQRLSRHRPRPRITLP